MLICFGLVHCSGHCDITSAPSKQLSLHVTECPWSERVIVFQVILHECREGQDYKVHMWVQRLIQTWPGTVQLLYRILGPLLLHQNMKVGHSLDDCTHADSIMAKLNHQRTQVQFCDCVVRGHDQIYTAHRCILAASSPVLASILHSGGVLVELKAPCLSDSILGLLLDYIYTGTLPQLDNKQCSWLISAAQYLEMDELEMALKTKTVHALEYCNTFDGDSKHTLLPTRTDGIRSPADTIHSGGAAESEPQKDTLWTHLPLDAGRKILNLNDAVSKKSKTDKSSDYIIIKASTLSGISETNQTSHKWIQKIGSNSEIQQISTECESREQNLSDASKAVVWQESKEEARSYSSDSTKTQDNELFQDEKAHGFCLQGNVKSEEMTPPEVERHNSYYCTTSVIRHSSSISRIAEGNASAKLCHDTSAFTGKKSLSEKLHWDIEKTDNQIAHYDNQYSESLLHDHEYSVHTFNRIRNNETIDSKYLEKASNEEQYDPDLNYRTFSQIHDMQTTNTTISSQDEHDMTLAEQRSIQTFQDKRIFAKRKLKEESSDKCSKSAKTDLVDSAATGNFYSHGQNTAYNGKNISNTKLIESLSGSEWSKCQIPCTGSVPSYSGHVFYHCESQTDESSPDTSPNFSDTPSEGNDAPILSHLREDNLTINEGQVVLLDISSKSSETLVSYKQSSEMGAHLAQSLYSVKTHHEKSQNREGDYQGADDGPRTLCREGSKTMAACLTGCTSACGVNCVHSSVSTSVSDHIPLSGMQTDISDPPSSLVQHAFQCSLCERSFSQRGSLNRHVRSHLGVRPFSCPQCPMTFSRQYRVIEHMRVHQRSALAVDFLKPPASSV